MPGGARHVRSIKSWKSPHERPTSMIRGREDCQRADISPAGKRRVAGAGFSRPGPPEGGPYFCADLIVPVTPSREQLNGSIFRFEGAYSLVDRGNACLKNSGSSR